MKLEGALTALVTPFTEDDAVDLAALRRIVKAQLEGGIDGLVFAGTTGESPTLEEAEKAAAVELVRELSGGKVPLIVGTGTNSTKSTIAATKAAKAQGADFALVVCPYYNKPTQEGLYQHFLAVHEHAGLPIIAYNVPGRTASDLKPETIARLVAARAIVAVKDATGDMQRAIDTLALVERDRPFTLLSGDDFTILPFVACGGSGVISVVSNLAPGDTSRLVRETARGAFELARPLQKRLSDLSTALFSVSSPIPVKAGMALLGLCSPRLRLPLVPANEATTEAVRAAMKKYGLL